jgi:hypothetical protein
VKLFSRANDIEVQSFMLKLVNNNCADLESMIEGPRLEGRVRLSIVALVIPLEKQKLHVPRMFAAVTKEFSTSGVAIVTNQLRGLDEVVLGFRWERTVKWVRAKAKHVHPMGAGFYQVGFRVGKMVHSGDYPDLETINF